MHPFFDMTPRGKFAYILRELRNNRKTLAFSKPLAANHHSANARENHRAIIKSARVSTAFRLARLRELRAELAPLP